jgi:hypothetical protein
VHNKSRWRASPNSRAKPASRQDADELVAAATGGHKANVADGRRRRQAAKGTPAQHASSVPPDVTRDIYAERCACGTKLSAAEQVLARAYDHVELPPIKPVTTRINPHRDDCPRCGKTISAEPPPDNAARLPICPSSRSSLGHGCQMVGYAGLAEMLEGLVGPEDFQRRDRQHGRARAADRGTKAYAGVCLIAATGRLNGGSPRAAIRAALTIRSEPATC